MKDHKRKAQSILVVDDDTECLTFTCEALESTYAVTTASDGDEALLKARKKKPDLIVLDVMMPGGKDGFSTFCDLRNDPGTRNIPVIMLSEVARITGLPFGADGMNRYLGSTPAVFLEKPVSVENLLNAVKKALDETSKGKSP